MFAMETRLDRVKAGLGPRVDGDHRPLALGLVRRILPVRRGRPASAARIPEPAPASGRPRATGGSGRTWPGAAPARRAPAPAGSSTASRPAP